MFKWKLAASIHIYIYIYLAIPVISYNTFMLVSWIFVILCLQVNAIYTLIIIKFFGKSYTVLNLTHKWVSYDNIESNDNVSLNHHLELIITNLYIQLYLHIYICSGCVSQEKYILWAKLIERHQNVISSMIQTW